MTTGSTPPAKASKRTTAKSAPAAAALASGKRSQPAAPKNTPGKNRGLKSKALPAAKASAKAPANATGKARSPKPPSPRKDSGPVTAAQLMQEQLEQARKTLAEGKALANHQARALRDAWLMELGDQLWPSSAEVAADLGVSASTVDNWRADGAPIEKASPVHKAPLLRWLYEREKTKGSTASDDADAQKAAVELRIKLARAAKEEGRLRQEAADFARQIIAEEVAALGHRLRSAGARALVEGILADYAQGVERQGLEATATAIIDTQLASVRDARTNKTTNGEE